jgi:hypothetical protein
LSRYQLSSEAIGANTGLFTLRCVGRNRNNCLEEVTSRGLY